MIVLTPGSRLKSRHVALSLTLLLGCATLRPTSELQTYQTQRSTREGEELKLRFPELVANADAWATKAREAQDDKEEEDLEYYGHVAYLWWHAAELLGKAEDLDAERAGLEKDVTQVGKELAEAKKREKLARDGLERMKQLIAAAEGKVADSQEIAHAREQIAIAMEALRKAQAVDANVHAAGTFAAAESKLDLATRALASNKPKDAVSLAAEAKAGAEAAQREAQPKYASTEADQARLNRQKALFDALSEIAGGQRSMVEGGVQITLVEVFTGTAVTIQPSAEPLFNKLAQTAKDFSDFALIIEGHTDSKGAVAKNLQLSESRAQSVLSHLAAQGVSPDRMRAVGKGSGEPIADNKTKEGRATNRRIEILFVAK